jgi:hypothetical protein
MFSPYRQRVKQCAKPKKKKKVSMYLSNNGFFPLEGEGAFSQESGVTDSSFCASPALSP